MLWILPINLPVLVVWIHNLAVHWLTPFSSHHNVLSIMPLILLVETLSGGNMIPRLTTRYVLYLSPSFSSLKLFADASRTRYVTNTLLFGLATYAAVYGVTYAYLLHHLVNVVAAWLVAVHLSTSTFSLTGLRQMLEGDDLVDDGSSIKKRP